MGGENQERKLISTETKVTLDGTVINTDLVDALVVDQDLNQPDMATVTFDDNARNFSGETRIGAELKIQLGRKGVDDLSSESKENLVFEGKVVAVEPRLGAEAKSICVVRAFNMLHELVRGRYSQSWENKSDKEIIDEVIRRGGYQFESVRCNLEEVIPHVYQHNQTDLEFVLHRASQWGANVFVDGKVLCVLKPESPTAQLNDERQSETIELDMEEGSEYELTMFMPRLSAAEVVASVEVRGWDPAKKEEITSGPITPDSESVPHGYGAALAPEAAGDFGQEVTYAVDSPVFSEAEAVAKASALIYESTMNFITGSGVCIGRPALRAGQVVNVRAYDKKMEIPPDYRFNGMYLLTGVTHRYAALGGYKAMVRFRRDGERPTE